MKISKCSVRFLHCDQTLFATILDYWWTISHRTTNDLFSISTVPQNCWAIRCSTEIFVEIVFKPRITRFSVPQVCLMAISTHPDESRLVQDRSKWKKQVSTLVNSEDGMKLPNCVRKHSVTIKETARRCALCNINKGTTSEGWNRHVGATSAMYTLNRTTHGRNWNNSGKRKYWRKRDVKVEWVYK